MKTKAKTRSKKAEHFSSASDVHYVEPSKTPDKRTDARYAALRVENGRLWRRSLSIVASSCAQTNRGVGQLRPFCRS